MALTHSIATTVRFWRADRISPKPSRHAQTLIEQLDADENHDCDKYRPNQPCPLPDHRPRPEPRANQLTESHHDPGAEKYMMRAQEHQQRADIAGDIHDFRVRRRARQIE